MNEVLLVDATEEIQPLAEALAQARFRVAACSAAQASERLAGGEQFGALLVCLIDATPDAPAFELVRTGSKRRMAVVGIVRREELAGLDPDLPLDDFVAYPTTAEELIARVRRAVRRRDGEDDPNVLRRGDLTIDHGSYKVYIGSQPVELTYKEYELLRFLALNEGKVCTRETLLSRVWGYDFYGGARTVDVHIRRLRSKIEDRHHTLIETVRNVGYRFRAD
jgi:two-component system alkaline phosphatase synthesis response regulator PhoP